ncbi:MAG: ATP-grasp domain-containing protein [Burkholderiales bacterium]|nr:ATP-grasp domain-containing protein [Burkholderiales bacterium]
MHLLYPCDPFNKKVPDDAYAEEFVAAQAKGIPCSLFSAEDFECGEFTARPAFPEGVEVVYRGWMLTPQRYGELQAAILAKGAKALTSEQQYRHCHYLPEWYSLCEDLTPKTVFLAEDADFSIALSHHSWSAFFVKDYVKSLTTSRGSVAKNVQEIYEIVGLIKLYRGQIEGGVSIRQFEDLSPETEERYFVLNGKAFACEGSAPDIVQDIAKRIQSPFFSVDIVLGANGTPRLIELGDGQVSDRKKWPAQRFVEIFHG